MHCIAIVHTPLLKDYMSLIQRNKLYLCLSPLPKHNIMKLANLSFVKGNLVMGMRQFRCQPSFKAVVIDFVSKNDTTECIVTGGRRYSADLLLQIS